MSETPVVGVRIPANILRQIDKQAKKGKINRSQQIIELLIRGMGADGVGADTAAVITRVDALEKSLLKRLG